MAKRKYAIFAAAAFAALQLMTGCGNDETDTAGHRARRRRAVICQRLRTGRIRQKVL